MGRRRHAAMGRDLSARRRCAFFIWACGNSHTFPSRTDSNFFFSNHLALRPGYALSVGFNESGLSSWVADTVLPKSGGDSSSSAFGVLVCSAVLLACGLSNLVSNVSFTTCKGWHAALRCEPS